LLVFALAASALASAAIACSDDSFKDNAVSSADLAVPVETDSGAGSALEIDTWKTLGGSGAWAHVQIDYPHFVAPTPSSAGGVINAKLETALQKLAEDQKDAASAKVTCSAPGDGGAQVPSANVPGLVSLACLGRSTPKTDASSAPSVSIGQTFNFRIVGDTVTELHFADVFTNEAALHPILTQALDGDPRVTAAGHDALTTADLSNVPFHFETVDDGHSAVTSQSHPLPAISFSFALAFPAKPATPSPSPSPSPSADTDAGTDAGAAASAGTDANQQSGVPIPVLSIAIADLAPALLPDGPAKLFTAPH